jgi:hypothetical protein
MKLALAFVAVAVASCAALYFGVTAFTSAQAPTAEAALVSYHATAPTAAQFAHDLAGGANKYGVEHSADARLTHTHCVQAARGNYMCSFAVVHGDGSSECHLIQARWTPDAASTFTVTLSGRVSRCGSLREAVHSLG